MWFQTSLQSGPGRSSARKQRSQGRRRAIASPCTGTRPACRPRRGRPRLRQRTRASQSRFLSPCCCLSAGRGHVTDGAGGGRDEISVGSMCGYRACGALRSVSQHAAHTTGTLAVVLWWVWSCCCQLHAGNWGLGELNPKRNFVTSIRQPASSVH